MQASRPAGSRRRVPPQRPGRAHEVFVVFRGRPGGRPWRPPPTRCSAEDPVCFGPHDAWRLLPRSLLLAVATIAMADDWYYHAHTYRLRDRPECQKEVQWHNLRSRGFALEFLVYRQPPLRGAAVGALAVILGISWYAK